MAADQGSGAPAPRNLRYFRAAFLNVRPSRTAGTIALEITDASGDGFCAEWAAIWRSTPP